MGGGKKERREEHWLTLECLSMVDGLVDLLSVVIKVYFSVDFCMIKAGLRAAAAGLKAHFGSIIMNSLNALNYF